jgi:hypothetical protein
MSEKQINYPKRKFRVKKITASIWEHKSDDKGKEQTRFSIGIQKSTKNPASGEWENQQIFIHPDEIPALITVAQSAYQHCFLVEKTEDDKSVQA